MQTETKRDPYEVFEEEFPQLAERFAALVDAQIALEGLDPKTKQLLNIGIQTANRNGRGVKWHAMMASKQGASRQEILGAVAMNLHLTGLAAMLEGLPAAIEGVDLAEGS